MSILELNYLNRLQACKPTLDKGTVAVLGVACTMTCRTSLTNVIDLGG